MSTETIIEKIRERSAREIAELEQAGEERIAAVKKEAAQRADAQCAQIADNAERQIAEIGRRSKLMNDLAQRKTTLSAKRALLDEAFSQAREALCALPEEQRRALMARLVKKAALTGEVKVRVGARDAAVYSDGWIAALSTQQASFVPDKTDPGFESGLLLVTDKADVDLSADTLIAEARARCESDVAAVLFEPSAQ